MRTARLGMLEGKQRRIRSPQVVAGLITVYVVVGSVLSAVVLPAVTTALVHAGWRPSSALRLVDLAGPLAGWLAIAWSKLPDYVGALAAGLLLARACPEWRWATSAACAVGLLAGSAAVTWWCGLDLVEHYRLLLPWELAGGAAVVLGALAHPACRTAARAVGALAKETSNARA